MRYVQYFILYLIRNMRKILVKYPSRQRPTQFLRTLKGYISKANDNRRIEYLISIDEDDESMSNEILDAAFLNDAFITIHKGNGVSKIEACNRDILRASPDWDVLLLVSDDMECIAQGWDDRIISDMERNFPDSDGCLWYHDGAQQTICTLSCIGRNYYDRFGYIYHPSYKSFFCDNEFTEIAMSDNKMKLIPRMIIKHQHPSWDGNMKDDDLYQKNNKFWAEDEANYHKRKANGFK